MIVFRKPFKMTTVPTEIEEWCRENIVGHYDLNAYSVASGFHARFARKEDAIHFKLRWLPDWQ